MGAPKTKREFLQKYKKDLVGAVKEQKRQNRETIEQRRFGLGARHSPSMSLEPDVDDETVAARFLQLSPALEPEGEAAIHSNQQ